MKKQKELNFKVFFMALLLITAVFVGCKKDNGPEIPTTKAYIGSEACAQCHQDNYDKFIKSGHPYKLNKVVDGKAPTYPYTTLTYLPSGVNGKYTWNDISYVIGGYGWKARYIDKNGYIITTDDSQYNLEDGSIVGYHADLDEGTKKYDCGRCHTTGWKSVADGGSPQDGLPGMDGEFFAGGIQCEACHGMGNVHAATQDKADISIDKSATFCGSCHYRNADHTIAASGGFIKHHEQYDALISGPHASMGCIDCHDPHASTKYDNQAPGSGVTKECTVCHTDTKYAQTNIHNGATCINCHMAKASKSAIKTNDGLNGDLKTHIFKINPAADGPDNFFTDGGAIANANGLGVPLNFICYKCHTDSNGNGGGGSTKTMQELSTKATGFHGI